MEVAQVGVNAQREIVEYDVYCLSDILDAVMLYREPRVGTGA